MNCFSWCKKNIWLIFLCIILVLLIVAPQLIYKYTLGSEYKGVGRIVNDDELYYMARANDIVKGHELLGNPYIYELKDKPPIQLSLPEYLLAKSLQLLDIGVYRGFSFYDIILPIGLAILTFVCLYLLTTSRILSFAGTITLVFGLFLLSFNRPVSPQFNFIFWLTQFIIVVQFIRNYNVKYFWLSILNLGFLFYVYTYFWTFYYVIFALALLLFYFFGFKDLSRKLMLIIFGGVIIGSYYFWNSIIATKLPEYNETLIRLGLVNTHWPSGLGIVLPGLTLFVIFTILFYKKKLPRESMGLLLLAGIAGSVVVANQHLITGKNLEFSSHYVLPAYYWFIFSLVYIFSRIIKDVYYQKIILGISILFALINVGNYVDKFLIVNREEIYKQQYVEIFNWLNTNTDKDDVVFANEDLSDFIVVYTKNNVFYSRNANLHFMSNDDVLDRFIINSYFENIDDQFIKNNERSIFGVRFIDACGHIQQLNKLRSVFKQPALKEGCLADSDIEMVLTRAKDLQSENFYTFSKKYRIDYIIWDANKNPDWNLDRLDYLNKEFEYKKIYIYKFI